jgi:hypothetical protein
MSAVAPTYPKPLPEVTSLTKPFWEAAKRHELVLQRCRRCHEHQWFPRPWCLHCGGRELDWAPVSGRGTVYSFTIIRQVVGNSPAFQADLPFPIGLIELEEGPRMYATLVNCSPDEVQIGQRVRVVFDDVTPDLALPKFELMKE